MSEKFWFEVKPKQTKKSYAVPFTFNVNCTIKTFSDSVRKAREVVIVQ